MARSWIGMLVMLLFAVSFYKGNVKLNMLNVLNVTLGKVVEIMPLFMGFWLLFLVMINGTAT